MPNCRKAATDFAHAWMILDRIKADALDHQKLLVGPINDLEDYLQSFYKELGRIAFEGHAHDISNLKREAEFAIKDIVRPDFVYRYAEDLQMQLINQGLLDIIDCQCAK